MVLPAVRGRGSAGCGRLCSDGVHHFAVPLWAGASSRGWQPHVPASCLGGACLLLSTHKYTPENSFAAASATCAAKVSAPACPPSAGITCGTPAPCDFGGDLRPTLGLCNTSLPGTGVIYNFPNVGDSPALVYECMPPASPTPVKPRVTNHLGTCK